MINITVDGVEISRVSPTTLSLSLSAETMRSVEAAAQSVDITVEVEVERSNSEAQALLSGDGYLHDGVSFNQESHQGEIRCGDEVLFSGDVALLSIELSDEALLYKLRFRRSGAAWATGSAERLIHDVEMEYSEQLTIATVKESWEDDSFVKFFPVHRDSYSSTYSSASLDTVQRIRSIDDYHPFINLYGLMMKIFEEEGYSVVSEFMESDSFKRLYISGGYVTQNSSQAEATMNFYVEKLTDVSTTANYMGRVNISPLYALNSVGYLIDIESIDTLTTCYTLGGCLTIESSAICFTPTQSVSVGLEVRLKYVADYVINSRTELKTFDTLFLDGSILYEYSVANKFVDQRDESIEMLFEYLVVAFDGSDSSTYQLSIEINGVETFLDSWTGVSGEVTTPRFDSSDTVGSPKLYSVSSSGTRTLYSDDWALYMGYVEMEGEVEVDITVRTPPKSVSPTSPYTLSTPFISGANSGMNFTLKSGTSLTPYFASCPGFGSYIDFSDISQHECYASDVIESARHLFNLATFSNVEAGLVLIEPEEDIYDDSVVWDWSDKIVWSEAITLSDVAIDESQLQKWGYQASDGVTTRIAGLYYESGGTYPDEPTAEPEQSVEGSYSTEYGTWVATVDSYATDDSTHTELNPLLSPTINDTLGLPIVGDRDDPDMSDTLDFSPRILSLEGMFYSENELIPNAVFFSESMGVNLCFEDRDGVTGLNRYYRERINRLSTGQYVELTLRLTVSEMLSLCTPNDGAPHLLSTFGLTLLGEWCEARIESIEITTSEADSFYHLAKCKFLIIK